MPIIHRDPNYSRDDFSFDFPLIRVYSGICLYGGYVALVPELQSLHEVWAIMPLIFYNAYPVQGHEGTAGQ